MIQNTTALMWVELPLSIMTTRKGAGGWCTGRSGGVGQRAGVQVGQGAWGQGVSVQVGQGRGGRGLVYR